MWATARRGPRAQPPRSRRWSSSRIRPVTTGRRVERGVGRVVERDAGGDLGVGAARDARPAHRGEVGQHRAEREAAAASLPARDRCVAEEVHGVY